MRRPVNESDYMGYGVYSFGAVEPTFDDFLKNPDAFILDAFGIQVLNLAGKGFAMSTLDSMTLKIDGVGSGAATAATIKGRASFIAFSVGDAWASEYRSLQYAVMVDKTTVESGNPSIILSKEPDVIAMVASIGQPFVVVDAPDALLAAAQKLVGAPQQPSIPEPQLPSIPPPPGQPDPSPNGGGQQPPPVEVQKAGLLPDGWLMPALIGAGVLTTVLVLAAKSKTRGR